MRSGPRRALPSLAWSRPTPMRRARTASASSSSCPRTTRRRPSSGPTRTSPTSSSTRSSSSTTTLQPGRDRCADQADAGADRGRWARGHACRERTPVETGVRAAGAAGTADGDGRPAAARATSAGRSRDEVGRVVARLQPHARPARARAAAERPARARRAGGRAGRDRPRPARRSRPAADRRAAAARTRSPRTRPTHREEIDEARQAVRRALDEVRRISSELRPEMLEHSGSSAR